MLVELGLKGATIIVVAPGSRLEFKRWPSRSFAKMIEGVLRDCETHIVLVGSGPELGTIAEVMAECVALGCEGRRLHNLGGRTTVVQLAALLRRTKAFVGNDGGTCQLAAAVGTRVVSIANGAELPNSVEPWGNQRFTARNAVSCSPCYCFTHCPRHDNRCVTGIDPETVRTLVRMAMPNTTPPSVEHARRKHHPARPQWRTVCRKRHSKRAGPEFSGLGIAGHGRWVDGRISGDRARLFFEGSRIVHNVNETNLGLQRTLNLGLALAKGGLLARIDNNDEWSDPEKLRDQVSFLNTNPDHALVGTGVIVVNEQGSEILRHLLPWIDEDIRSKLLFKNCFIHSSVVFRKSPVIALGGYSIPPDTRHVEDYDLWLRLGRTTKMANLNRHSVRLRLRAGSISAENKIDQLRKDLKLAILNRRFYPRAFSGILFCRIRVVLYRFFSAVPGRSASASSNTTNRHELRIAMPEAASGTSVRLCANVRPDI